MFRVANLVCLDAPLVAVAWQARFAQAFAIPLGAASRGRLFLTTWAIYLLDRWADGTSLRVGAPRSGRQRFARRHARVGLTLLALVVGLDALLVVRLAPRLMLAGGLMGVVCIVYLLINRTADRLWRSRVAFAERLDDGGQWLLADFRVPNGRLKALRARMWLTVMYAFFRIVTGLRVRRLVDPAPLLAAQGLTRTRWRERDAGFLGSALWTRTR